MLGAVNVVYAPPQDPALVERGRRLFFSPALSAGKTLSCASCHDPARTWAGGTRVPGGRDVPSLLGASRPGPFFLDGRAASLEDAILSEFRDPRVMGLDDRALSARLDALEGGAPDPAGESGSEALRAARALAAFLRAEAVSGESAFDRAERDPAALTPAAARGLALFAGKGRCASCHTGPWLTDSHFYRVGLRDDDPVDAGRGAVTPVRQMRGAFRTAPLRDVARTAPYMHDGALPSLRAVVDFYDRGGDEPLGLSHDISPIGLTEAEKKDLVSFLEALSGAPRDVARPAPVPVRAEAPLEAGRSRGARARRALAARDRDALRDAADSWARALSAARKAGDACLTNAAAAAGDLAEMAANGRDWPVLGARLEHAAEWARECAFRRATAAGGRAAEEDVDGAPGAARADALLARAAALASARLEAGPGGEAARACRESFTFDGLLAKLRARVYDDDTEQNVTKQALVYASYEAVRRGDPRVCDALSFTSMAVGSARTGAERCRESYTDLAGARALFLRDPAYLPLCRENVRLSYPEVPEDVGARTCSQILAGIDEPEKVCASLSPLLIPPALRTACAARFRLFSKGGTAADCQATEAGPSIIRDSCLDMAAFAQARAAGDAAKCGDSAFCRLLMGEGRAQEQAQLDKLKEVSCRPLPAPAGLARVLSVLDQAEAELAAAEAARLPGDRAGAAALARREERAARLRASSQALFSDVVSSPSPY